MAEFQTLAGTVIGISATLPATHDALGFEALTFTTVGLVESLGEFGKVFELVTFKPLDSRGTLKAKGSYDNGSTEFSYAIKAADGGQTILIAASDSDDSQALSFTYQDGSVDYITGIVMGFRKANGSTSDVYKAKSTVEFDTDFVHTVA